MLLYPDFSIRISAGQSSLTAHRSFSQLTTSFIGSQCQGIHPALFFALPFAFHKKLFSCFLCWFSFSDLYANCFGKHRSFYPTSNFFSHRLWVLFDVVVLKDFTLSTRSFLIFALHLLFSFQDTPRKTNKFVLLWRVLLRKTSPPLPCSFQNRFQKKVSFLLKSALNEILSDEILWMKEWAQVDSNHRPHAYQACALTGWAMGPFLGGDEGNRTPDPLLAKQVLSQLSYTPIFFRAGFSFAFNVPSRYLQNWTMQLQVISYRRKRLEAELGVFWVFSVLENLGSP